MIVSRWNASLFKVACDCIEMAQEHHRPLSDLSADALRAKAMEYRKIADRATDPTVARALRYLAERYERVAAERKGE